MLAALRFRKGQAFALLLLSACVVASIAFAPMYVGSVDDAVVRARLGEVPAQNHYLSVSGDYGGASSGADGLTPRRDWAELELPFAADLAAVHGPLQHDESARVTWGSRTVPLRALTGMCAHLRIDAGRCSTRAGEVVVSTRQAKADGLVPGRRLSMASGPTRTPVTVVGTYTQPEADPYWRATRLERVSVDARTAPDDRPDTVLTAPDTFDGGTITAGRQTAQWPLLTERVTPHNLGRLSASSAQMTRTAAQAGLDTQSPLPTLREQTDADRRQVRDIAPLLMLQLAVLLLVVLQLVLAAAVDQRRPEMALARLRGMRQGHVRRRVLAELGLPLVVGIPVGLAVALAADLIAARVWLPPGVRRPSADGLLPSIAAAVVVVLGLLVLTVARAARQPIAPMLRAVPTAPGKAAMATADVIVLTGAVTATALAVTGGVHGRLALAVPTVLALGAGVLVAHLMGPVLGWLGRRAARRGRPVQVLAAAQVTRRPATRRTVAVLTVAVALVVVSLNLNATAAHNRERRAEAEIGAPLVAEVDFSAAPDTALHQVDQTLHELDPSGRRMTPLLLLAPGGSDGVGTAGVDPDGYRAVAYDDLGGPVDTGALKGRPTPAVTVQGSTLSMTLGTSSLLTAMPAGSIAGTLRPSTHRANPTRTAPDAGSFGYAYPTQITRPRVFVRLKTEGKEAQRVELGPIPDQGEARVRRTAVVPCPQGCRLLGIDLGYSDADSKQDWPRGRFGPMPTTGALDISDVRTDRGVVAGLDAKAGWVIDKPEPNASGAPTTATSAAGVPLRLRWAQYNGPTDVAATHKGSTPSGGVIVSKKLIDDRYVQDWRLQVPTLEEDTVAPVDQWRSVVPGIPPTSALISARNLRLRTDHLDAADQRLLVMSRDASPAAERRLVTALKGRGLPVVEITRESDRRARYDASASGWSMQLGIVVSAAALALALLVMALVVATSWRRRTHDVAALRMAGVPAGPVRRAAVIDQLVVGLVSVVAGAISGVLGSALIAPEVPLFATEPSYPVVDLATRWWPVVLGALGCMVAIGVVAYALARRVGRGGRLSMLREPV